MALGSTEQFSHFEEVGLSSVLQDERPTHFYDDDEPDRDESDESHIIRSTNLVDTNEVFPPLMREAYPNIDQVAGQADAAFDLMKAGDFLTVANVTRNPEIAMRGAMQLLDTLKHIDTGAIDLPKASGEERLGAVAGALVLQAHELGGLTSRQQADKLAKLTARNDQLEAIVSVDQVEASAVMARQAQEILDLTAEKERLQSSLNAERTKVGDLQKVLNGKTLERFREPVLRIRSLGAVAFRHTKTA